MENSVLKNHFSEEELKTFSESELKQLEEAFGYVELAKYLPKGEALETYGDRLTKKFEGVETGEQLDERIIEIGNTDPNFINEMLAVTTFCMLDEQVPAKANAATASQNNSGAASVQKVSLKEIKAEKEAETKEAKKASKKAEYMELLKTLNNISSADIENVVSRVKNDATNNA